MGYTSKGILRVQTAHAHPSDDHATCSPKKEDAPGNRYSPSGSLAEVRHRKSAILPYRCTGDRCSIWLLSASIPRTQSIADVNAQPLGIINKATFLAQPRLRAVAQTPIMHHSYRMQVVSTSFNPLRMQPSSACPAPSSQSPSPPSPPLPQSSSSNPHSDA